jgi:arylsulfatase A-like enzyme
MTNGKILCLILCGGLLLPAACGKGRKSDFRLIRVMERLRTADIRQSPLAAVKTADLDLFAPAGSIPLNELGTGDNPYGIKRKVNLADLEMSILFAPPKSEYSAEILIPNGAVLEFGTGIIRERRSGSLTSPFPQEAEGVDFRVRIEAGKRKKEIFQKYVALPPLKDKRTWAFTRHKIKLPEIKGKARITLITRAKGGAFSFWHNPVVYSAGRKAQVVVLVSVDTLRADHLRAYGYGRPTSPNLDKLAADAVVFTRAYASSPWTLPSHVSLLTSLFNIHHGVYNPTDRMDDSLVTLAEVITQNHFLASAFTGGGFVSHRFGFSRGFDTYKEGEGTARLNNSAEQVGLAASEWIERNKDKSFFLFLHTYQVHSPFDTPAPYNTMFLDKDAVWRAADTNEIFGKQAIFKELPDAERRNLSGLYDAEIRYTDETLLKAVVGKLKAVGLYEAAMIIFTSDHGEEFFEHGAWEHGAHLYDESIQVPLVIKFPGSRFHGKRVESVVRGVDVMPTVLEQMGIKSGDLKLDGQSLLPLLKGDIGKDRPFLADTCWLFLKGCGGESGHGLAHGIAANDGRYKIILNNELGAREMAFYDPPVPVKPAVELYDLNADPREATDLSTRHADLANTLAREVMARYAGGRKTRPSKAKLSQELEEQLRGFGYIR